MTDTNISNSRRAWRQSAIALVLIGGGFALGAASVATAHGDMDGGGMGGWHGGWHHDHHGPRVGTIQRMVHGALDNVGATTAQEDKVHDIIAKASTDLDKDGDDKGAMKKQVLELMKAPTLDRAAFDKLRADKIAAMDAKSKTIENALFEAASQLSPEQRTKLVANVQERMEHHGWGGWHHHDGMDGHDGEHGMHDGGGMGGPHDGGGAPDHG